MRRVLPIFLLGVFGTLTVVFGVMLLTRDDDPEAATATTIAVTSSDAGVTPSVSVTTVASTDATVSVTGTTAAPPGTGTGAPTTRCAGRVPMTLPDGVELVGGPGNFDGAPEPDSIMDADGGFVFASGGSWYVGFSLNDGYVVFEPLPSPLDPAFEPDAVVWNFSGDDGLLVHIDRSGMSGAEVYAFYFLDADCQVEDAGTIDVERFELLDWFGASHTQGFQCTADGVFATSAGQAGTMWDVRDVFYEWTAPAAPGFVLGFEDGMEVPAGDPAIAAAGDVNC